MEKGKLTRTIAWTSLDERRRESTRRLDETCMTKPGLKSFREWNNNFPPEPLDWAGVIWRSMVHQLAGFSSASSLHHRFTLWRYRRWCLPSLCFWIAALLSAILHL